MKIKAKANGNVIDAHEDAAKELIAAGIYEETNEPLTSTLTPPIPPSNTTQPEQAKAPAKRKGRKAK